MNLVIWHLLVILLLLFRTLFSPPPPPSRRRQSLLSRRKEVASDGRVDRPTVLTRTLHPRMNRYSVPG